MSTTTGGEGERATSGRLHWLIGHWIQFPQGNRVVVCWEEIERTRERTQIKQSCRRTLYFCQITKKIRWTRNTCKGCTYIESGVPQHKTVYKFLTWAEESYLWLWTLAVNSKVAEIEKFKWENNRHLWSIWNMYRIKQKNSLVGEMIQQINWGMYTPDTPSFWILYTPVRSQYQQTFVADFELWDTSGSLGFWTNIFSEVI